MGSKKFAPFMMKKIKVPPGKVLNEQNIHFKRVQKWGKICIYIILSIKKT